MELNNEIYKEDLERFLFKNSTLSLSIQKKVSLAFDRCKKRLDKYYITTEPLILEKANEGNSNFYFVLDQLFFFPFNCKVKYLSILQRTDFKNFIGSGLSLNSEFYDYSPMIMKEIYHRMVTNSNALDVDVLIQDFEDYLYYHAIHNIANANVSSFYRSLDSNIYPDEPLLGFGLTFLKYVSEHQISNHEEYKANEGKLNKLISLFGRDFKPFNNFPKAINVFYSALSQLDLTQLSKERFLEQIANLYSGENSKKIELDLGPQSLTRRQIGYLFYRLREVHCTNFDKPSFREWLQSTFTIKKRNGEFLILENNQTASDLLSSYRMNESDDKKLSIIQNLMPA